MDFTMSTLLKMTACLVLVMSGVQMQTTSSVSSLLSCYQCNSGADFDGPNCMSSNATLLAQFAKPCPMDGRNYTRCRKQFQTVETDARIIRSCALASHYGAATPLCISRLGTASVSIVYCECYNSVPNTKTPCNQANGRYMTSTILTTSLVIAAIVMTSSSFLIKRRS
jgi:hypothetical protein